MNYLNHDVLDTLLEALGEADFFEINHTFVQQFERQLQACRQQAARGDSSECARILHSLKGGAGNIGAQTLAELAETCERQLRSGEAVLSEAMLDALSNTTHETIDELRRSGYLGAS